MVNFLEPTTVVFPVVGADPIRHRERRAAVATGTALVSLSIVLLYATVGILPEDPLIWVLTPARVVLGVGLVALLLSGAAPALWRTSLAPAVASLLFAAALATVVSRQDWSAWRGVLTSFAAFVLAFGVRRLLSSSRAALGQLSLIGVAVAGGVGIQQAANDIPTGFCRGAANALADTCGSGAAVRIIGTFGNPNLLAAFLVLMLPLAAFGVAVLPERSTRLLGTAIIVLGYLATILTWSRSGVLGALAGAVVFILLRRRGSRRLVVSVAALCAVIVALVVAAGGSVGVRGQVWTAALRLLLAHPLGVGLGRAGPLISARIPGNQGIQHAHNLWLNWAVEAGYPGLVAMLAVTVVAAIIAVRASRGGSLPAAAIGAGLAGFAVICFTDDPVNALRVSLAFWIMLGLLAGEAPVVAPARKDPAPTADPSSEEGPPTDVMAVSATSATASSTRHRRSRAEPLAAPRSVGPPEEPTPHPRVDGSWPMHRIDDQPVRRGITR